MKVHDYIMDKILEKPEVPTASQVSMGGVGPGSFTSGELDGLPNSTIDSSVTGTVSENGPVSRVPWYESINSTGSNPNSTMLTRMSSIEGNASRFPTERHKQVCKVQINFIKNDNRRVLSQFCFFHLCFFVLLWIRLLLIFSFRISKPQTEIFEW
jgi:hypothetical protein